MRTASLSAAVLLSACIPGAIDLSDRECPCAAGWYCAHGICVEGVAPADAGIGDAGRADAGMNDAGMSDAGVPDAGTLPDAGPDSTSCDDVNAGRLFCDGLEDPALTAWSSFFDHNGTVARTEERSYRGVGALRSEITASGGYVMGRFAIGGITSGTIHLRAYFYVPSSVTIAKGMSLMQVGFDSSPYHHVSFNADEPTSSSIYISTDSGTNWARGMQLPRDRWFCAELVITIAEAPMGQLELWIDGARTAVEMGIDTLSAPRGYERFVVGIPYTELTQTSALAYADEVVYDDEPIGCD